MDLEGFEDELEFMPLSSENFDREIPRPMERFDQKSDQKPDHKTDAIHDYFRGFDRHRRWTVAVFIAIFPFLGLLFYGVTQVNWIPPQYLGYLMISIMVLSAFISLPKLPEGQILGFSLHLQTRKFPWFQEKRTVLATQGWLSAGAYVLRVFFLPNNGMVLFQGPPSGPVELVILGLFGCFLLLPRERIPRWLPFVLCSGVVALIAGWEWSPALRWTVLGILILVFDTGFRVYHDIIVPYFYYTFSSCLYIVDTETGEMHAKDWFKPAVIGKDLSVLRVEREVFFLSLFVLNQFRKLRRRGSLICRVRFLQHGVEFEAAFPHLYLDWFHARLAGSGSPRADG